MTGIVNSTGAKSGIIGTTVGTSAATIVQVIVDTYSAADSSSYTGTSLARVNTSSALNWKGTIDTVDSDNWVYISMSFNGHIDKSGVEAKGSFGIFRESTVILETFTYGYATGSSSSWVQHHLVHVDKSPATGTNNYYLGYKSHESASVEVKSSGDAMPFTCILFELKQ